MYNNYPFEILFIVLLGTPLIPIIILSFQEKLTADECVQFYSKSKITSGLIVVNFIKTVEDEEVFSKIVFQTCYETFDQSVSRETILLIDNYFYMR